MSKKTVKAKKPTLEHNELWSHQKSAITTIRNYFGKYKKDSTIGSALVNMPTGSGKSGVMACVAHFLSKGTSALVLSPRITIRDQLAAEIEGRFFHQRGLTGSLPKSVHNINRGWRFATGANLDNKIFVMTNQMLQRIREQKPDAWKQICKSVDLVLVDEGHYEPAAKWSDTIRGMGKARVIFTATPFRNDLKLFDVNFDHAFSYTLLEATKDNIIRRVQFKQAAPTTTPQNFVTQLVGFYEKNLGKNARAIIRCDNSAQIRLIGEALKNQGQSYILIHETFNDTKGDANERKTVPRDLDSIDATFWVHQFKLLEGIDPVSYTHLTLPTKA